MRFMFMAFYIVLQLATELDKFRKYYQILEV